MTVVGFIGSSGSWLVERDVNGQRRHKEIDGMGRSYIDRNRVALCRKMAIELALCRKMAITLSPHWY